MNDIITVKDLRLWYGQTQALKGVSMDIPEKSITALIGPSGCGKSTFLKTLDRMNDLVPGVRIEGEVQYNGQNIFAPQVDVNELRRLSRSRIPSPGASMTTSPTAPGRTACAGRTSSTRSSSSRCAARRSGTRSRTG